MEKKKKCCIKGCDRPMTVFKHNLCHTHYVRLLRTGEPGGAHIRKRELIAPYQKEERK